MLPEKVLKKIKRIKEDNDKWRRSKKIQQENIPEVEPYGTSHSIAKRGTKSEPGMKRVPGSITQ